MAGAGVFLGLSANTVTLLHAEGMRIPALQDLRVLILAGAAVWSVWLAWRIAGRWSGGVARLTPALAVAAANLLAIGSWALLFWLW